MFPDQPRRTAVITRRDMLARSSVGFGLTALTGLLASQQPALSAAQNSAELSANRTRSPRARNVIFCFMSGGVSHVDSFDPKPRLKRDHGKVTDDHCPVVKHADEVAFHPVLFEVLKKEC